MKGALYMKRKVVSILLAVSMMSSVLVACGSTNGTNGESSSANSESVSMSESSTSIKSESGGLDLSAEGDEHDKIDWDTHPLLSKIPDPNTDDILIDTESDQNIILDVENVSAAGFKTYVKLCKDNGFTESPYYTEMYYDAKNGDGYHLNLDYDEEKRNLRIWMDAPVQINSSSTSNTSDSEIDTQSTTPEPTNAIEEVTFDIKDKTVPETGVRQEIKDFVESYEAFAQSYSDFMKTYWDSNTEYTDDLYNKYNDLMKQAEDYSNKYSALTEIDLSTEEYTYILESYSKIVDKLYDY